MQAEKEGVVLDRVRGYERERIGASAYTTCHCKPVRTLARQSVPPPCKEPTFE